MPGTAGSDGRHAAIGPAQEVCGVLQESQVRCVAFDQPQVDHDRPLRSRSTRRPSVPRSRPGSTD